MICQICKKPIIEDKRTFIDNVSGKWHYKCWKLKLENEIKTSSELRKIMKKYKTIEVNEIPLEISKLAKFIEYQADCIENEEIVNSYEIISFESYGMKLRGEKGYKVIFLLKLKQY